MTDAITARAFELIKDNPDLDVSEAISMATQEFEHQDQVGELLGVFVTCLLLAVGLGLIVRP